MTELRNENVQFPSLICGIQRCGWCLSRRAICETEDLVGDSRHGLFEAPAECLAQLLLAIIYYDTAKEREIG